MVQSQAFFDQTLQQQYFLSQSAMKSENLNLVVVESSSSNNKRQPQTRSTVIDIEKSPHAKNQNQNLFHQNRDEADTQNSKIKNYDSFLENRVIEIQDPELIKEGILTSYKLYKVKTKKIDSEGFDTVVNRRFNDFEFLHHEIIDNYGGYVLPKLPEKNFLANLNLETRNFAHIRTKQLQKYLQKLLNHSKVRYSGELRHFLFDEQFDFSFSKGEFSEQSKALDGLKAITSSVYDITKSVYSRIVGKKDRRCEFSKVNQEQAELKLFEREVEDLVKVTKQISGIVNKSSQEFTLIHELSILSNHPHLDSIATEQQCIIAFRDMIQQFEEISSFIDNCRDAISRTKNLRAQIQDLEDQLASIELKERENPRNRDLDIIRSKIQKSSFKCQKWISSLKKELSVYTSEGKTLMEHFVKKFTQLKGEIYSMAQPQF